MSFLDSIGDFFKSEGSHVSNLMSSWGKTPGKTLAQFALGAQDPLGAKIWSGVTGEKFTPSVGQFGGETNAQFAQSRAQGQDTGLNQTLGQVANVVAAVWGGAEAGGAIGGAFGDGAGAGEGAAGAGGDTLGEGASEAGAGSGSSAGVGGATDAGTTTSSGFGGVGTDPAVSGTGAGGGSTTASSESSWLKGAETAGKVLAPTVLSSLLAPKPPKTKAPTAMPDPLAQQQAVQQKLIAQMARRGRASTILTNPSNAGSLGG